MLPASKGSRHLGLRGRAHPNPIRKAHATACKRAGIEDFRPHDWRHHWASWAVMKGLRLPTIQELGGWKTIVMVMRYAAVSTEHKKEAMKLME
ncbi:MAG: tyrosine-type recombinase/integrase [Gammaproteobacteria bacterium]|nr:tyrosine-type recombinase/integrase [Gammaproteobacteria bacterium]